MRVVRIYCIFRAMFFAAIMADFCHNVMTRWQILWHGSCSYVSVQLVRPRAHVREHSLVFLYLLACARVILSRARAGIRLFAHAMSCDVGARERRIFCFLPHETYVVQQYRTTYVSCEV